MELVHIRDFSRGCSVPYGEKVSRHNVERITVLRDKLDNNLFKLHFHGGNWVDADGRDHGFVLTIDRFNLERLIAEAIMKVDPDVKRDWPCLADAYKELFAEELKEDDRNWSDDHYGWWNEDLADKYDYPQTKKYTKVTHKEVDEAEERALDKLISRDDDQPKDLPL